MLVDFFYLRLVIMVEVLDACRLQLQVLVACRLRLGACVASGARRNILESTRSLVQRVSNVVYFFIPALSTAAALVVGFLSGAGFACPYYS